MKLKVLILTLFLSTLLPAQKPRIAYKEGIVAHKNKRYKKAIKLLTIAIKSGRKKYKSAYFLRGDSYEKIGNRIYATDDYIYAYDYYPNKIFLGNKIARMLYKSKSYSQSLIFVKKTLSIDSTNFVALKLKAINQIHIGNFEKALLTCDYASTLKSDAELTYAKALASDSLKLKDYAFAYYKKAITQDSLFEPPYNAYARLLIKNKYYDKALEITTKATRLFNNSDIFSLRAEIYAKKGLVRKQINDITKELTLNKTNYDLLFKRALLYVKISMFNVALTDINRFLKHEPNNKDALFLKAQISQKLYKKEIAIDSYKKFISLSDNESKINEAKKAIYILKKENHKPDIVIKFPPQPDETSISINKNNPIFVLKGQCIDKSAIKSVNINNDNVDFGFISNNKWVFSHEINIDSVQNIEIKVTDEYNNTKTQEYRLIETEQDPPIVKITNNITINDSTIKSSKSLVKLKGLVFDKSPIKSCIINNKVIKLIKTNNGYKFDELIDLKTIDTLKIITTDLFANTSTKKYIIEHPDSIKKEITPLGKTWVLLIVSDTINNHPIQPITKLKDSIVSALKNFNIDSILIYSSLTKEKLERNLLFELPKLTQNNRVNSLLIYYIGPGMTIENFTYWIVNSSNKNMAYASLNTSLYRTIFETLNHVNFKSLISESVLMGQNIIDTTQNSKLMKDLESGKIPTHGEFAMGIKVENWQNYSSPILETLKNTIDSNKKLVSLTDIIKTSKEKLNFGKIIDSSEPIYPIILINKRYK